MSELVVLPGIVGVLSIRKLGPLFLAWLASRRWVLAEFGKRGELGAKGSEDRVKLKVLGLVVGPIIGIIGLGLGLELVLVASISIGSLLVGGEELGSSGEKGSPREDSIA